MPHKAMNPAGLAKVQRTQRRVLDALTSFATASPPIKLSITAVCIKAGISPDALALPHHANLKAKVERSIAEHNAAHFGNSRKRANPASDVAVARIARLEGELEDLRDRYSSAVRSIKQLALALEEALARVEVERLHKHPATSSAERIAPFDRI